MKTGIAVVAISAALFLGMVTKKDPSATVPAQHPIETVFDQYKTTASFDIPEGMGATEEEKRKWSLLRDVIACESASRWVIVEVPGIGWDVGPCMINTYYHIVPAARMGLDIMQPAQNMAYCIRLFEQYYPEFISGAWTPWEASRTCWEGRQTIRIEQSGG